jgi:predicted amidophosphoribosyltransferase
MLRTFLKAGDEVFMRKYASRVREEVRSSALLAGFFEPTDLLVPVPGSAPFHAADTWASHRLAMALVNAGLGDSAWTGLQRVRAVRKSATAAPGRRPTVGVHYDSFHVDAPAEVPEGIVLIDDVVTRGRTLLAAASRLHEAFPGARIRAFALLRTMGLVSGIDHLLCPCKGQIRWKGGDAYRNP